MRVTFMVSKRLIAPVLASLLLAGCTAPAPAPVPTSTPSPVCTPEAGGAEYPCTQAEFEKMKARDALYAEAEEVNRQFQTILNRMYRTGAPTEVPADLKAITAGSARKDVEEFVANLQDYETVLSGGEIRQVWVKRNVGSVMEGSSVSLSVCVDASSTDVMRNDELLGSGNAGIDNLYFKDVDGRLVIWATKAEEVESCD